MAENVLNPRQPHLGSAYDNIAISQGLQSYKTNPSLNHKFTTPGQPNSYWELTEDLRNQYKTQILPKINTELQCFFDCERKVDIFTIEAYMIGKSQEKAKATILLIGRDPQTREGAKRAIKDSRILAEFANWKLDDTSEFPGLSRTCDELSILEDFEFFSSDGTFKWFDQQANLNPSVATEVYLDIRTYSERGEALPSKGIPIYIKHSWGLRPATANNIQLHNQNFMQTVYHAFRCDDYTKGIPGPEASPRSGVALPNIEDLVLVGRLLVCSVDKDWAIIEILNESMKSLIRNTLKRDTDWKWAFQRARKPSDREMEAYAWKAASNRLVVTVSETTIYMKLPNSCFFQEVHKARLRIGSWSNGDCGVVVTDCTGDYTLGHILGGSRTSGIALILAADRVLKDFHDPSFSSRLHNYLDIAERASVPETIAKSAEIEMSSSKNNSDQEVVIDISSKMREAPPQKSALGGDCVELHERSAIDAKNVSKFPLHNNKVGGNTKDWSEQGYLWWEAPNGGEASWRMLLNEGKVNINTRNTSEQKPLLLAAQKGHEEVVKLLLATGEVDVDTKDQIGWTPLLWAVNNGNQEVVKLLRGTGKVDVDANDWDGRTPLWGPVRNRNEAAVRLVLETGKVDVNTKDQNGRTTLWWAVRHENETAVKLLLSIDKAEADTKDWNGWTPLLWAVRKGNEEMVKLLLATGKVDVDAKDQSRLKPLSPAVKHGFESVVKLLLETGKADIDVKDQNGRTAR